MRTVQPLENAVMYDLSLLHFRLNTLGSFLTFPHLILSFPPLGLRSLDLNPGSLFLDCKMWHSLETGHVTWSVKHQSLGTMSTLLGCHIFPSGTCMQKGVPGTLNSDVTGREVPYSTELNTGNMPVCRGCLYS